MSDVLDEYRQWQARWPARVWQTHYIGCYVHHHECMIHRLVDEVERLRNGAPACCETVTDHDAAPAARAEADRERPDNPPARPGDGTGDTTTTHAALEATDSPATWQDECAAVEVAFERSGVRPTWPEDEVGNIGPMAHAMADEIVRLRLTDAEREAIRLAMNWVLDTGNSHVMPAAATLRGLLARHGGE